MSGVSAYKVYTIKVPAGGEQTIFSQGSFLRCFDCVGATNFLIALDNGTPQFFAAGIALSIGQQYGDEAQFSSIRVRNDGGAEITVVLGISSTGEILDNRLNAVGSLNVQGSTVLQSPPAVVVGVYASAQLLPANPNRKRFLIRNTGSGSLWIAGSNDFTGGRGMELGLGESIELETGGEVWGFNQTFSPKTVYILECL